MYALFVCVVAQTNTGKQRHIKGEILWHLWLKLEQN
jgi:hypothetical protein